MGPGSACRISLLGFPLLCPPKAATCAPPETDWAGALGSPLPAPEVHWGWRLNSFAGEFRGMLQWGQWYLVPATFSSLPERGCLANKSLRTQSMWEVHVHVVIWMRSGAGSSESLGRASQDRWQTAPWVQIPSFPGNCTLRRWRCRLEVLHRGTNSLAARCPSEIEWGLLSASMDDGGVWSDKDSRHRVLL